MPSEHSSGNDGKPAFSDSDVLAATEERGETMDVKSDFPHCGCGNPGVCNLPGTKAQRPG